ncbi:translation initiation inhibitor [Aspergillus flavus]|uniref:Translation initiation inhibitor n=1 Tax=Aspergillus flavus TaxID=5059 RepID=A0AB74CLM9_ASPFL|nr:translation initiation inhibitor [Aspergillus flavus]
MADLDTCLPLTVDPFHTAHRSISLYIHRTPVLTSKTLDRIASTPQERSALEGTHFEDQEPAKPVFRLYFKCEKFQKIGALKARGAFHAVLRLFSGLGLEEVRKRGVTTHSSGNHAQALALAAATLKIPAHIVMPSISTSSKIAGTKAYNVRVLFGGSTEPERTCAILVPPYDHPDIILGQGTAALELEKQVAALMKDVDTEVDIKKDHPLNVVITPLGGGEPSFQGGDDGRHGLAAGSRIPTVSTLTIADGLRTPVGEINWTVIPDQKKVRGVFAVTEDQIKDAMKLVLERMKLVIEPSAAVPLAVVLFDEEFRTIAEKEGGEKGWDVGVIFSGGNTTVEAIWNLHGYAKLLGIYSHSSLSYAGTKPQEAMQHLIKEIEGCKEGLQRHLQFFPLKDLVISVGATTQALSSQFLLQDGYPDPELNTLRNLLANPFGNDLDAKVKIEIHAGVYPLLNMQQFSTNASIEMGRPEDDIAILVLAEVCSVCNDGERPRPEALLVARTLALGRPVSFTRPIVERISQEHSIVSWEEKQADSSGIPRSRTVLNLKAVLESAGSILEKTVEVKVFLSDMEDFEKMNEVYLQWFGDIKPART